MSLSSRLLASCAVLAVVCAPALAADYDPPIFIEEAPEYVPVEIGSGWYLRGDVSYNINRPFRSSIFGPSPNYSFSESTVPVSATIGAGYRFSDFLRAEANIGFLSSHTATLTYQTTNPNAGTINNTASAENNLWSGIVSMYGDLGTFAGFTPYVGGGIGLVTSKREYRLFEDFADTAFQDRDFRDENRSYSVAYTVGAGVAYQIANNVLLDVGYQYLSAPKADYVRMNGLGSYTVREGLNFHQVKVGLRYELW